MIASGIASRTLALSCAVVGGCAHEDEERAPDAVASSSSSDGDASSNAVDDDGSGSSEDSSSSESTGEPAPPIEPGLFAEYFAGYHERVLARVEASVDVDWGDGAPAPELSGDRFSVRWSGWLTAPESGAYTLVTDTDDGVRLWVDDELVVDDWTPHFVTRNEAAIELVAGMAVPMRLEYFEVDLAASARLSWSSATLSERPIASEFFTTTPTDDGIAPAPPYRNPSLRHDGTFVDAEPMRCADPGVIAVPDAVMPGFYAACTGGEFPIRWSPDLVLWQETGASILPSGKASWAKDGTRNWAPEIHRVGATFVASTLRGTSTTSSRSVRRSPTTCSGRTRTRMRRS